MRGSPAPIEVFYCYVDEDEKLCRRLEIHLGLLRQQGIIADDHKILPGRDRIQAVDSHFMTASVILLLISPNFLASASC